MPAPRLGSLAPLLLAAAVGCAAGPAPESRATAPPTPAGMQLDEAGVRAVIAVEQELATRRSTLTEARRARNDALARSESLPTLPRPEDADRSSSARVAADLGLDPAEVERARRRIAELTLLEQLRVERQAAVRFRKAHLASLRRSEASAAGEDERARLAAMAAEVEAALERELRLEAEAEAGLAAELDLLHAHAPALGLTLPRRASEDEEPPGARPDVESDGDTPDDPPAETPELTARQPDR